VKGRGIGVMGRGRGGVMGRGRGGIVGSWIHVEQRRVEEQGRRTGEEKQGSRAGAEEG
jgi:hypothetical protein